METIFDKLNNEHELHKTMLKNLINNYSSATSVADYIALKNELSEHAKYEERFFYKPLFSNDKTQDKARHGVAEHHQIDKCLKDIDEKISQQEDWRYYLNKLEDLVLHHIEEELEFFQVAKKVLGEDRKVELGNKFSEQRA